MLKINILREAGYEEALLGLSLSYERELCTMPDVARRLAPVNGGHNKFLESIAVWIDMTMPRHFWQEFDTYRAGVSKQSSSTMHTLVRKPIEQQDFYQPIPHELLVELNRLVSDKDLLGVKNLLPEGYLQRRIVCTNYKTLRNIISQRYNHRNTGWLEFCATMLAQLEHPEFIQDLYK